MRWIKDLYCSRCVPHQLSSDQLNFQSSQILIREVQLICFFELIHVYYVVLYQLLATRNNVFDF